VTLNRSVGTRCNIGPAELARRRRSAYAGTAVTVVVLAGLLVAGAPGPVRLLVLWPIAAGAAVAWLQVTRRFCVAFGALGLENFGRLGAQVPVDAAQRAADRRQALRTIAEAVAIGLALAVVVAALPV